ncbi:restriction endonuclease [Paenibacillus xylanexedens]|uniref:restriction endonuclease n=1 Tax=Paenibacillus xylanexedens TaxID=528191 RepID=UPI001642D2E1|nr:restriction endonuclease [Paenibacillus xylanexedens]
MNTGTLGEINKTKIILFWGAIFMKWQEYQNAVGELYNQMDQIGEIKKNITIPDKITGQPRQVDVYWEINGKNHRIGILIDAKLRKSKLDVKDVEEVFALADSVKANKAIIVTNTGLTEPARKKAEFIGMDIKIFSIEEALETIVEDYWQLCPSCENDCIIMDSGSSFMIDGLIFWSIGGRCRTCKTAISWCQECGHYETIEINKHIECTCGHKWGNDENGLWLIFNGADKGFYL